MSPLAPCCFVLVSDAQVTAMTMHVLQNYQSAVAAGKPLIVNITDKKEQRSLAQNRLYWMWVTQISKHFGDDKDGVHFDCKRRFLIKIYMRDDAEYAATCAAVIGLKGVGEPEKYRLIADFLIDNTSTTDATTEQMTEYLNEIFVFYYKQGLRLSVPEDLKWAAEGGWV